MSTTAHRRIMSEDELGEHLTWLLGEAALKFVHSAGAPARVAAFALGAAAQTIAEHQIGRSRTAEWLRELADALEDGEDAPPEPVKLN